MTSCDVHVMLSRNNRPVPPSNSALTNHCHLNFPEPRHTQTRRPVAENSLTYKRLLFANKTRLFTFRAASLLTWECLPFANTWANTHADSAMLSRQVTLMFSHFARLAPRMCLCRRVTTGVLKCYFSQTVSVCVSVYL